MNIKNEAINYLSNYERKYKAWVRCAEQMKLLREKQMTAASPNLTGMPKARGNIDLSEYVVRLEMQIAECREKLEKARQEMQKVKTLIDDVYDNRDRAILSYRYIDFLSFGDIADVLDISKATVIRRHDDAVVRAYKKINNCGRSLE